jgi:molybdopterin converting factor small subunit
MKLRVQLFARARDLAGASIVEVDLAEPMTVGGLRASLGRLHPALSPLLSRLHVAVNSEYAADGDRIPAGAEIACFPPVSGG